MKTCRICKRADVAVISEALRQGMPVRVVADIHKASKTDVGEHRKDCLRLGGRDDRPNPERSPKEAAEGPATTLAAPKGGRRKAPDKPGQAGPDSADKDAGTEGATDVPKYRPPRARPPLDPKLATSFDERVLVCADMFATGQMNGHRTAAWLSSLWGVGRDAIAQYRRAGEVVARADRGDTSELMEDALGACRRDEEDALRLAEWLETLGEFQAAGRYRELAQKARAKYIEVAGLVTQKVSISLEADPRIAGLWRVMHATLEELDRAREAYIAEVAKLTGGPVPTAELPVPSEHVTAAVRKYEAETGGRKGLAA